MDQVMCSRCSRGAGVVDGEVMSDEGGRKGTGVWRAGGGSAPVAVCWALECPCVLAELRDVRTCARSDASRSLREKGRCGHATQVASGVTTHNAYKVQRHNPRPISKLPFPHASPGGTAHALVFTDFTRRLRCAPCPCRPWPGPCAYRVCRQPYAYHT